MNKFWIVFGHEYLRHVKRKRFILGLISIPLFMAVIMGVSLLATALSEDTRPVGYIDQSGLFKDAQPLPPERSGLFMERVKIVPFEDETNARNALEAGEIQAFYIIQPDYLSTGNVKLIAKDSVESSIHRDFSEFLLSHLLKNENPTIRARILEGPQLTLRTVDSDQQFNSRNPIGFIIAIFSGVIFLLAVNTSGGYLLQAVVEEKENRTMEVVLTSISTDQFMAGKIFGNLSVGLTQLLFWLVMAGVAAMIALRTFPDLSDIGIGFSFFGLMALTFLPAFVMIAALMTMVGATATESREAQQIAGLFSLPIAIPFWFIAAIMENPNGPLAIGFSFFPFTAPMTLPLRSMLTNLPVWQIVFSVGLLIVAAAASIWLASRAFRLGMLRYGKKLTLAELLRSR
jgi:ABC-2 type transport system permease protein